MTDDDATVQIRAGGGPTRRERRMSARRPRLQWQWLAFSAVVLLVVVGAAMLAVSDA
jgi:cell division septal protein FtsQ